MARKKSQHELDLEIDIGALEALARAAEKVGSYQAAVTARGRLISARAELCRTVGERVHGGEKDSIKRVERMREQAVIDGSWVAAASLAETERRLGAEELARRQAEEERRMEKQDIGSVVAEIEASIQALPDSLRSQMLERLAGHAD